MNTYSEVPENTLHKLCCCSLCRGVWKSVAQLLLGHSILAFTRFAWFILGSWKIQIFLSEPKIEVSREAEGG